MLLKIRPGRYLTRDGRVAVVRNCDRDYKYPWNGTVCGTFRCWNKYGKWWSGGASDFDLIRRLPSKPKRKTVKGQWGVWVPCLNRDNARSALPVIARTWNTAIIDGKPCKPTVRRLPPACAKRGG